MVSKPVCVGDVQCPKGPMTKSQKGPRERNMSLVSEIISSDLGESQESIFWCKKSGGLRFKTSRQTFPADQQKIKTRIAQSEHNVSPIATGERVANQNGTSVTSKEFDILNILKGLHSSLNS